jgi:hypothetical protein
MTLAAELKRLDESLTPGKWTVFDGCSWRRIGLEGTLTNVIEPTTHPYDRHPDLHARREDLDAVCALRNLLPSLVALAEREAWQPIASAPRDGTLILLHGHDQINPGYYDATPRIGGYGPWHWGITFQPTHWMRLPEPPTPKE